MSEENKKCPFCGAEAQPFDSKHVGCPYCIIVLDTRKWNTRPLEDALRELLETTQKRLYELGIEAFVTDLSVFKSVALRIYDDIKTNLKNWR